jgi:hypothetical protein
MNKNLDLGDHRTDTVSSLVQPAFSEAEREMGASYLPQLHSRPH